MDTFTSMETQLNGSSAAASEKYKAVVESEKTRTTKRVKEYARSTDDPEGVEAHLLDVLGL